MAAVNIFGICINDPPDTSVGLTFLMVRMVNVLSVSAHVLMESIQRGNLLGTRSRFPPPPFNF